MPVTVERCTKVMNNLPNALSMAERAFKQDKDLKNEFEDFKVKADAAVRDAMRLRADAQAKQRELAGRARQRIRNERMERNMVR
jgi:hypothetical protein